MVMSLEEMFVYEDMLYHADEIIDWRPVEEADSGDAFSAFFITDQNDDG